MKHNLLFADYLRSFATLDDLLWVLHTANSANLLVTLRCLFFTVRHNGAIEAREVSRLHLFGTSSKFICCRLVRTHKGNIHVCLDVFLQAHAPKDAIDDAPAHAFANNVFRGTLCGAEDATFFA